ncbi:cytochrome c oxidase cbb3-type subunit 1 [Pedobacter sp. UYP24]
MKKKVFKLVMVSVILIFGPIHPISAQPFSQSAINGVSSSALSLMLCFFVLLLLVVTLYLHNQTNKISEYTSKKASFDENRFQEYVSKLSSKQIDGYFKFQISNRKNQTRGIKSGSIKASIFILLLGYGGNVTAQTVKPTGSLFAGGGIIITLILIIIPIIAGIIFMIVKIRSVIRTYQDKQNLNEGKKLADYLRNVDPDELERQLLKRKQALDFALTNSELSGSNIADDDRGLVSSVNSTIELPIVSSKKRAVKRPQIDPALSKLIIWFIGTATFWLLFGTTVGEYLGIKFVSPDVDQVSWLSFGRLRPVHTNAVFWGWASLAMLGLGYYIVPRVGNAPLASVKAGWWTLYLINTAIVTGSLLLMAGINNGGGEYREYIWPVQLLFGIALVITLINFLQTIAKRKTKEIYISNWYIVASVMFAIVISIVAYVPAWQNGLGETIIQGYYMHQGVGMWFMLFTLGIVYYFLPQQLNKPIYSYSLGILAFWAQILFYTVIGTHHFVFSSIPWWLQTTAIIGSVGMIIPVAAGTANFILTFNGAWYKIPSSYTLPFFLVGIIFYFTGSLQGTAEAFRSTNLMWHFTDFTVAHSHITMYGIICFFLWAAIYALLPRLTGREAPQITIGTHFWLALIGLMFYTIPLMYGSTLKGLMWIDGKPFIDSVVFMAPFWLWRAIGGSLMWLSHLFFAYNIYKMIPVTTTIDVQEVAIEKLNESYSATEPNL